MEPLTIHHVAINVTDVPESLEFYVGKLGGRQRTDRPDFGVAGAWINLGSAQVHLIEAAVPPDVGQHFAIQVGDVDTVVDELRSKGLEVGSSFAVGSNRQAFVKDPSGNVIELHEVGAR